MPPIKRAPNPIHGSAVHNLVCELSVLIELDAPPRPELVQSKLAELLVASAQLVTISNNTDCQDVKLAKLIAVITGK